MNQEPIRIRREDLYHQVWAKSLSRIWKELGTSYPELVRACEVMNVPRPGGGHWANVRLGIPVQQTPLPEAGPDTPGEVFLRPVQKIAEEELPKLPEVNDEAKDGTETTYEVLGQENSAGNKDINEPDVAPAPRVEITEANEEQPKVVTYDREQLYEAIWSTPCLKLAESLGVSDVALAKTCRRLGVPRPPRGYWAKVEVGDKPRKERLPEAKQGQDRTVAFHVVANRARREGWAANSLLTAGKSKKPTAIELPPEAAELHPITERHKRALEKVKPGELGYVLVHGKDLFCCDASLAMVPKLLRAMDAVICELDDRDYEFEPSDNEFGGLRVIKDKDSAQLRWSERKMEIEREPTNVDKRKPSWTWNLKETKPSGELSIEVDAPGLRGKRKWTEGEGRTLEEVLGVVVEKIEATFKGFEEQRQREARWVREREDERQREAERRVLEAERKALEEKEKRERERLALHKRKLEQVAQARRDNLATAAQQWIEAEGISVFVRICEERWREAGEGKLTTEQAEWLQWAKLEASKKYPWVSGYPQPTIDGGFNRDRIPIGGPYPDSRKFEDTVPDQKSEEQKPQVKTVYVETPQPPEPFPYWLLHRRH